MNAKTQPTPPDAQREQLLDSERRANAQQPRNFKEDALEDKIVAVEPDGTGPTPTETFDPHADRKGGSGSGAQQHQQQQPQGPGREQTYRDKQRNKQSDHQADEGKRGG